MAFGPPDTGKMHAHPDIEGAYLLETDRGRVSVTFRRKVLDEYAPEVRLLTYGTKEFNDLMSYALPTHPALTIPFTVDGDPVGTLAELNAKLGE